MSQTRIIMNNNTSVVSASRVVPSNIRLIGLPSISFFSHFLSSDNVVGMYSAMWLFGIELNAFLSDVDRKPPSWL